MFGFCQNWIFGQKFDFSNSVKNIIFGWWSKAHLIVSWSWIPNSQFVDFQPLFLYPSYSIKERDGRSQFFWLLEQLQRRILSCADGYYGYRRLRIVWSADTCNQDRTYQNRTASSSQQSQTQRGTITCSFSYPTLKHTLIYISENN